MFWGMPNQCPFLEEERKTSGPLSVSQFDPTRTLARASAVGSHRYKQLSRVDVAALLHVGVLGCDMEIAEPPWQHRILIHGRAAAEREAHLGDAQACIGDPYGGLSTFRQECFVPQSAGTRVAPMAGCLDLRIWSRRPTVGLSTSKRMGQNFRIPHCTGST